MLRLFDPFERQLFGDVLLVGGGGVDDMVTGLRKRFARITARPGVAFLVDRRALGQRVAMQFTAGRFEVGGGVAVSDAANPREFMRTTLDVRRADRTGFASIQ